MRFSNVRASFRPVIVFLAYFAVVVLRGQTPTPPTIVSQPSSSTITVGSAVSFSVSINGTAPFTYVWKKGAATIPSATGSIYAIASATTADAGTYTVTISNSAGSVTTSAFTLTVNLAIPPTFASLPSAVISVTESASLSLSVSVNGTFPFSYQWNKDGVAIAGATSASYIKSSADFADAGSYTVTVTNAGGAVTSTPSYVSVLPSSVPVILSQPVSQLLEISPSLSLSLSVSISSPTTTTVQWRKDGVDIVGATSTSFFKSGITAADAGLYTCAITNRSGTVVSDAAAVTTTDARLAVITTQPGSRTVATGESASLSFSFTSVSTTTIQWKKNGVVVPNATSSALTFSPVAVSDSGSYTATLTNPAGSVTTIAVQLNVNIVAPRITLQPTGRALVVGNSLSLAVGAAWGYTNSGTVTYQWSKDGATLPSATSSSFTLSSVALADAGTYTCAVTAAGNSVISDPAVVTIATNSAGLPPILTQPTGAAVIGGSSYFMSVSANSNNGTSTYQWRRFGVNLTGQTASSLFFPSFTASDAGPYTCVVTNNAGATVSATANMNLISSGAIPLFISQPAVGATASIGSFFGSFSVSTFGEGPITYQWRKDGVAIPGATSVSFSIGQIKATDAGAYTCVATNANGSTTSEPLQLVVPAATAPVITRQPAGGTITAGGSGNISVTVTGTAPLTYQWRKNGSAIIGATNSSFSWSTFQPSDVGVYSVVVTNALGVVTSSSANMAITAVPAAPTFIVQPASQNLLVGSSVVLSVNATGVGPISYQWQKDGANISGATANTIAFSNVQTADSGSYVCVATNATGSAASNTATLSVGLPSVAPTITAQPIGRDILAGASVSFSVTASGTPSPTFQWKKDGAEIAGATSATLTVTNVQLSDAASYTVIVSNSAGSVSSTAAVLVVSAAPVFVVQPVSSLTVAFGASLTLTATVSGSPAPSFQWSKDGAAISGATNATLTVASAKLTDAGSYTLTATNTVGGVTSRTVLVTVTPPDLAGTYFGKLGATGGAGDFAVLVRADRTGVLLMFLPGSRAAVVTTGFSVALDGSFSVTAASLVPNTSTVQASATPGVKALIGEGTSAVSGTIAGGQFSGVLSGLDLPLLGSRLGGSSPVAGYYEVPAINGGSGALYLMVAPSGNALVIGQNGSTIEGGTAIVTAGNLLSLALSGGATLSVAFDAVSGNVSATADKGAFAGIAFMGLRAGITRTDRLANLSTRALAGAGEDTMIAGFTISGSEPRTVLLRAIGPSLADFGVAGVLSDTRLDLFRGAVKIAQSDNWGEEPAAAAIASTAARVGAFSLGARSKDAVILATLDAGSYTALVSGAGATSGVAMIEIYDAGDTTLNPASPRLINLSSRVRVGTGDDVLITGLVIQGNVAKRVLVRAIGPTLAGFGIGGVLADPELRVFSGTASIAANDNWAGSAEIANAAASVGAFPLPAASRDACAVLTLAPGSYTIQIRGVGATSGIALVEIYELAASN